MCTSCKGAPGQHQYPRTKVELRAAARPESSSLSSLPPLIPLQALQPIHQGVRRGPFAPLPNQALGLPREVGGGRPASQLMDAVSPVWECGQSLGNSGLREPAAKAFGWPPWLTLNWCVPCHQNKLRRCLKCQGEPGGAGGRSFLALSPPHSLSNVGKFGPCEFPEGQPSGSGGGKP